MSQHYDVIIAGAGPVGLLLASELALAGRSVVILERDASPESPWKSAPLGMRGLNKLSVEFLYRRGLLHHFVDTAPPNAHAAAKMASPNPAAGKLAPAPAQSGTKPGGRRFVGHFAGLFLDAGKLEPQRWKYGFRGPASKPAPTYIDHIEKVLTDHAVSLGVTIRRGTPFTRIVAEDAHGITVEAGEAGESFRGRWLVGCDGGRSAVRHAADFEFVGTEPKYTAYAVQCEVDQPDQLQPGSYATGHGMYYVVKPNVLHLLDFDDAAFDRTQEITREHLQEVLERVTERDDIHITTLHRVFSYTDRCKQATQYRRGRVLLAGDAAHIHSPLGAQGMNLGLGDAMNLGWKLAATVQSEVAAPAASVPDTTLLDTYESERHPVGEWALGWTQAQVATLMPGPYGAAIRSVMRDLLDTPDGTNLIVDRLWGLSRRYQLGDGPQFSHELIGASAPDVELADGARLGVKMQRGRGLLVESESAGPLKTALLTGKYADRIDHVSLSGKDSCGVRAMLVRSDGIVVWVAEENAEPDVEAAKAALERWFDF